MATSSDAGASAHGCSGAVVRLTVDDPVVLLPPGDKMAPAQDKVLRAHDSARKRALGPMLTAERVRCKRPRLSKPEVELALWLRGVPPARKAGGAGTANVPVLEAQLLGLFGETPAEPDDDGASSAPLLVTAVGSCLSVADMGRCVRSSLLHPAALAGGVQGHEKAPLAHKLPSTADPLRKILRCLDELAAFERDSGEFPKLHAAVKEAHEVSDPARRAALLNALRVETDDAIQRCATKGAAEREKRTRDVAAQNGAARLQLHPVLSRLGHKGRFRLLWEYYKAYSHKRPALDAPAILHCGVPGPIHNDPRGRRTRTPGMGVVTRTIRVTKLRRTRTQYQTGTTPQRLSCSMSAKVGLLCDARRVHWTTLVRWTDRGTRMLDFIKNIHLTILVERGAKTQGHQRLS